MEVEIIQAGAMEPLTLADLKAGDVFLCLNTAYGALLKTSSSVSLRLDNGVHASLEGSRLVKRIEGKFIGKVID